MEDLVPRERILIAKIRQFISYDGRTGILTEKRFIRTRKISNGYIYGW